MPFHNYPRSAQPPPQVTPPKWFAPPVSLRASCSTRCWVLCSTPSPRWAARKPTANPPTMTTSGCRRWLPLWRLEEGLESRTGSWPACRSTRTQWSLPRHDEKPLQMCIYERLLENSLRCDCRCLVFLFLLGSLFLCGHEVFLRERFSLARTAERARILRIVT